MISLPLTSAKGAQLRNEASASSSGKMVHMETGLVLERIADGKAIASLMEFRRRTKQRRTLEMKMKVTRKSKQISQSRLSENFVKRTFVSSLFVMSS